MSETETTRPVKVTKEREQDLMETVDSSVLLFFIAKARLMVVRIIKFLVADCSEAQITNNEIHPKSLENKMSPKEALCLRNLKEDFTRGIVAIDLANPKRKEEYVEARKADKTAGATWKGIQGKLLNDERALLEKASKMQGGGRLIGIIRNKHGFPQNDTKEYELCIIDRGAKPVIYAKNSKGEIIVITTDTRNRAKVTDDIRKNGQFANYFEILRAVKDAGYIVPEDFINKEDFTYQTSGIIDASEAVTNEPYVRSGYAILNCGNVPGTVYMNVVFFSHNYDRTRVMTDYTHARRDSLGTVRVLIG